MSLKPTRVEAAFTETVVDPSFCHSEWEVLVDCPFTAVEFSGVTGCVLWVRVSVGSETLVYTQVEDPIVTHPLGSLPRAGRLESPRCETTGPTP